MAHLVSDNPQIELARRYIEQTGVSLFLTGKAGTGKTTFLKDIDATCNKRHVVVAPTGVAAVNAGGVTIHSFFQLPFDPYLPDIKELVTEYQMPESHKSINRTKLNIIRTLELLIIDEISMVRADLMDAIDMTLRRYRRSSRPFGGVQLLMIGDVHQLSPVVNERERPYMEQVYPSPYFFNSKALQRINYATIELTTVYRQQDEAFVDLLNHVRNNQLDDATLTALNSRVQNTQTTKQSSNQAITLTTHNRQADAINHSHMEALTGDSRTLEAVVSGNYPDNAMPLERTIELKVGERVMFIKNDSSGAHSYYNGKLGTVDGFDESDDGLLVSVIDDDGETIPVGRELWENVRYDIDHDGSIKQVVDGTFSQYPLRPAWAVTIHKAQGLTFDRVVIDAADAFAFGQVYVALSRCRTLEGLTLSTPLSARVAFGDSAVSGFVSSRPSFERVSQEAATYEAQYYLEQLTDLFSLGSILHEAESFDEVYTRLKKLYPDNVQAMHTIVTELATLASVSEKFAAQLMRLPTEQHPERVAKACDYYLPKLSLAAARLSGLVDVDIDNKENRKAVAEGGERLLEMMRVKLAALRTVHKHGFSVSLVQQAKADVLLKKGEKGRTKAATEKATRSKAPKPQPKAAKAPVEPPAESPSEPPTELPSTPPPTASPELVNLLKDWRKQKAAELNVSPFIVLHQQALLAIATAMPQNVNQLKKLPGIGTGTVQRYGKEILDLVADYREAYGLR